MKVLLLVFLASLAQVLCITNSSLHQNSTPKNREVIIRYENTLIRLRTEARGIICHGFFIHPRFVATAAICIKRENHKEVYVRVRTGPQEYKNILVKRFIFYPNWSYLFNNVALLELQEPANNVTILKMDSHQRNPTAHTKGHTYYSKITEFGFLRRIFRYKGRIMTNAECSQKVGVPVDDFRICFKKYGPRKNRKYIFEHRYGSPLIVNHENDSNGYFIGIYSSVYYRNFYSIQLFEDLRYHYEWFELIITAKSVE